MNLFDIIRMLIYLTTESCKYDEDEMSTWDDCGILSQILVEVLNIIYFKATRAHWV